MNAIFTLCSNNYLAQAKVLADSVRQFQPGWTFLLGLVDKKDPSIDYPGLGFEVLELAAIEPKMTALAQKYSIIELNTCVKPTFFQYLFERRKAAQVIYLDPDTCLYGPMDAVIAGHDFVLTPHILSPIPLDGLSPEEPLFLNYGLYNLGFLALKRSPETQRFLRWWRERTYQKGFDNPARGLFTDQLWINLVPLYFEGVSILRHPGYNMGPWNLHERFLRTDNILESGEPLVFYHFSGFKPGVPKLHKDYTRYTLQQRSDLRQLYQDYEQKVIQSKYLELSALPCHYVTVRNEYLALRQVQSPVPFYRKTLRQVKGMLPVKLKKLALDLIKM